MATLLEKFTRSAKVLYDNPLLINAYVELAGGKVVAKNWGDDINYHFIRHLTKRPVAVYFDTPVAMALNRTNYLCIGSTLNYLTTRQSEVWGAGVIDEALELRERPARVHAVRGPLTRDYLLARGISCPDVYGDPALLIPFFHKPTPTQSLRTKACVVPHYADRDSTIMRSYITNNPDVDIIDISFYGTWTDLVDRISQYAVVLSSSLHGLIVAESFGVPNYWVSISDKVIGRGFKFRDYFASIGKRSAGPLELQSISDPIGLTSSHPWTQGRLNLSRLLDACPFKIKEPVRHEHPMDLS